MSGDGTRLEALRARLATEADVVGALDVAWRAYDSPIGRLTLAATEQGLVRVALATEPVDQVLGELAERVSPRVLRAPARLDEVAYELDEYFAGQRRGFDVRLDRRLSRGFRAVVQQRLSEVPYGATVSYSDLAELAGNRRASRAAATACATNPLPVVVPCHRVVRADGSLGDYRGGPTAKRLLLTLESA